VREWGMSDRVGPMAWGSQGMVFLGEDLMHTRDYSDETARVIDEEVERILRDQEGRARETLSRYRRGLDAVAEALLENETLAGDDHGGHGLDAIAIVQIATGDALDLLDGHVLALEHRGTREHGSARVARARRKDRHEPRRVGTIEVAPIDLGGHRPLALGGRVDVANLAAVEHERYGADDSNDHRGDDHPVHQRLTPRRCRRS